MLNDKQRAEVGYMIDLRIAKILGQLNAKLGTHSGPDAPSLLSGEDPLGFEGRDKGVHL